MRKLLLLSLVVSGLVSANVANADETLLQSAGLFYRIGLGGLTTAEYASLPAEAKEIIDQGGMLAKLNYWREKIANSVVVNNPNIVGCTDVPTSGQFTDSTLGATIKLAVAQNTAPAGYPSGGGSLYDKRAEFVRTVGTETTKGVFEFKCGVHAMMIAIDHSDSGDSNKNYSLAIYFDGESETDKHYQFYMTLFGDSFAAAGHVQSGKFNGWLSSGKPADGDADAGNGYRTAIVKHADGTVSFFADDTTSSDGSGDARIAATAVSAINAPDQGVPYQGCATSYDQAPEDISSNILCSGDTLSAFTASLPGLADFSTKEVYDKVPTAITGLIP